MANPEIEKVVDGMIASGRISRDMRDVYVKDLEAGLSDHLLRAADYTKKTQELAQGRRDAESWLQNERQRLQQDRQKLEHWQGTVQAELDRYNQMVPELTAKVGAYEQALRDYSVDGRSLLENVAIPSFSKQPAPTNLPNRTPEFNSRSQQTEGEFMTMKAAGAALRDFAILQSKVNKIQIQHMKLFGEPLEDDLINHYLETGQDPEQHWQVKYNVEARRQHVLDTNRLAEIARIKEETRAEIMKELALDPGRVVSGPLGKPQGALSSHLEQYTQSRALAYSQPHANDRASTPDANAFVPPEKKPELMASRERIAAASKMFNEHFDVAGNPTTDRGKQLFQKYNE